MSIDLIVYGVVAAGLIVWLRGVLGTRHGDEREPPSIRLTEDGKIVHLDQLNSADARADKKVHAADLIAELYDNPTDALSIERGAKDGLLEITRADKTFDVKDFLAKTQDVFAIVVEAFAEGDRETLKALLVEDVYQAFEAALTAREEAGETMATDIHAVRQAIVLEAGLDKSVARIAIRFTAEETTVTRDQTGEIIAGHPDKVSDVHDIWVFGRHIKSSDPRWLVYETRGDFEEDNDVLPNTQ